MAHTALSQPLFCLQLRPGQKAWERLPRKADITVTEGSIVVHQRLWLAGTWVHLPVVVGAGEQLRVAAGGWVEMEAMGAARVHCMAALAWWQIGWLGRALRRVDPITKASWLPTA
ncbi:hypothetical protein [Ottowia thiooxydans]|uniref:hypothetical protein n=1 Tax=Ottowia thiooxydans TaxID=219182 RepID=UPI0003FE0625|nr:hypothetical protein [Ottowia thiooxydans]